MTPQSDPSGVFERITRREYPSEDESHQLKDISNGGLESDEPVPIHIPFQI